ncbi:hypothetical protein [Glutamicibacter sp. PS]|uniref:hypothetical protein n=1 Tax=Glutamicibacter sp. PS TaxID=3075634 RepID=UPI0028488500|nr:hypothetical protein [Glutamicibacter sp. PS]MDR4534687.1 hypothetical protein [Glutamicibacter sp. PS]
MKKRISRSVAVVVALSLGTGIAAPAVAQTAPAPKVSVERVMTQPTGGGSVGMLQYEQTSRVLQQGIPQGGEAAFWQKYAVKAALMALKKTNKKLYNKIISKVGLGKKKFVAWYNKYIRPHMPGILGSISAAVIYDVIKWIIGI